MKKLLLLSALYFATCNNYTPAAAVGDLIVTKKMAQSYSNVVDEDMKNLGIDINSIPTNSMKMLACTEQSVKGENFLVFFIYDKDLYSEIKNVNITVKHAATVTAFNDITGTTKRYKTKLVATSSNGCVHKYMCQIDQDIQQYHCKEYVFGRVTLETGESTSYPFTTTINGSDYQYSIQDVITLNNTKAASIYLEQHNDYSQGLLGSKGRNNVMYGLSVNNYKIDQLEEIEFIYDLYNFEAVACGNQFLWSETLKTSNGFFDEEYINSSEFKSHGVTYSEEEMQEIKKYYPDYYELVERGVDKVVTNTTYETKTHGIFKHNTYKWDSIIKMSDLENHASKETAELIKKTFPSQDFVVTVDSFDVEKRQDSKVGGKSKLCQLQKDQLHKTVGTKERDPRYWWLQDKYGIKPEWPSYDTMYYCSKMPKNIEVVRMKFIDEKQNPYDLSVITTPIDITDFTGDPNAEKSVFDFVIDIFKETIDWLKKNQWILWLVGGILVVLFALMILSPVGDILNKKRK